jgi:hypothetical protein
MARQLSWGPAWRSTEPRERLSEVPGWKLFDIDPVSHQGDGATLTPSQNLPSQDLSAEIIAWFSDLALYFSTGWS